MLTLTLLSLLLATPLSSEKINSAQVARIIAIAFFFSALLVFSGIDYSALGSGVTTYGGLLQITSLSSFLEGFVYLIGAFILLLSSQKGISSPAHISEFSILILITTMGSSLLVSAGDTVTLYLAIELQSLPLYVMCSMSRNSQSATSAGLKYFVIGAIASSLILLGSSLLYSISGHTNFAKIFEVISTAANTSSHDFNSVLGIYNINESLALALVVLTLGLVTKIGAAPFHFRSPDVYDGSPTIVTTRLTIVPKIALFGVILNLFPAGFVLSLENAEAGIHGAEAQQVWLTALLLVALASTVVGTVLGLAQTRIKRLLAYSTISHLGFMFLGLSTGSIEGRQAMLFYLIQYSVTSLGVFAIVIAFGNVINSEYSQSYNSSTVAFSATQSATSTQIPTVESNLNPENKDLRLISDLAGIAKVYPILAMAFTVALFSMAGVPPLLGFFAKLEVLISAVNSGYFSTIFVAIVAILGSVLSANYYIQIIKTMYFDSPKTPINVVDSPVSSLQSFIIAVVTLILLITIIHPDFLVNTTTLIALSFFTI